MGLEDPILSGWLLAQDMRMNIGQSIRSGGMLTILIHFI
jgi:hypothetical protein